MNLQIPLNSHVNTSDEFIITNLDTQNKNVLNKKNTLMYKSTLAPMYTKSEAKVFTTAGHTIALESNQTLIDENGRTYAVDNEWTISDSIDISNLWSGDLTSAIYKDGYVYSVWKGERDYTIVVSDNDDNVIATKNVEIDTDDLLYYNVKLANYTRKASKADSELYLVVQTVYSTPKTTIQELTVTLDDTAIVTEQIRSSNFDYLTGKDLYVLRAVQSEEVKTFIGTDDTDLRKRFTFLDGVVLYKYWGCLGANGLLTGEPILTTVSSRANNTALSAISITQDDFGYLSNGIAYGQQLAGSTDATEITANASLNNSAITTSQAHIWGGVTHTRSGTKSIICGFDLEAGVPLVLSPSYVNAGQTNGVAKSTITALDSAVFATPTIASGDGSLITEQVDFSDSWGNHTWTAGTTAAITNGCNPFPYKYMIMNRAESKGRYWDYGPGWARCYFRQGIITSFRNSSSAAYRTFIERYPTSIVSFGLSSISGKNSVRQEYLDPILRTTYSGTTPWNKNGWVRDNVNTGYYAKHHNLANNEAHIWVNFIGADNLGDHVLLNTIPFNVDICPELNLKDQYYGLQYMSTSLQGTLLTSASVSKSSDSMLFILDDENASLFSNGLILVGKKYGDVKLTKIADYIYRTNTLTGNNLFIDSTESFYGQRGFIPFNGEEIITLDEMEKSSPIDDSDTDGNDTYYSGSGYNTAMTDMKNRGVSYVLPALTIALTVLSSEVNDFTYQLASNKKEITKPLLYNQFTYKDEPVDHFYTHSLDTTSIEYQTGKKMETSASGDTAYFGIPTYDINKAGTVWYVTSSVYFYPMGIASPVKGINYLSSTVDMTDNYSVRLYRTQNVTFPVYNPTTEVYKGSTIFTIYGYNYSFDGQSIYYLGSGDTTAENNFACYALGMQFLANSGVEAYFYSPFEKRIYLFTGSNTLQVADSLSREGEIIDSIYSSCEQILYLLTAEGNVIAKSQQDMSVIEKVSTNYHFEGTDSGMILADGFSYKKYRLWKTDETEWLPIEYETEFLGKNDSLFKVSAVEVTFFRGAEDTVKGNVTIEGVYDKLTTKEVQEFELTKRTWETGTLKKLRFVPKDNTVKAFRFGINSDDYIWIANVNVVIEEVSQNTNAPLHR